MLRMNLTDQEVYKAEQAVCYVRFLLRHNLYADELRDKVHILGSGVDRVVFPLGADKVVKVDIEVAAKGRKTFSFFNTGNATEFKVLRAFQKGTLKQLFPKLLGIGKGWLVMERLYPISYEECVYRGLAEMFERKTRVYDIYYSNIMRTVSGRYVISDAGHGFDE